MDSSFSELSSAAAATDSLHELLVLSFGLFFSLTFLPGILRKTSKKSLSDCLLLPSLSDCRNTFTHIMMVMIMMKCFVCRLNNTFAVHKEPIILQQEQVFFVFLFFSFVFSLVCNSGSCNWGLRSSSSIICIWDPGPGRSSLMLYLSLIMGSFLLKYSTFSLTF